MNLARALLASAMTFGGGIACLAQERPDHRRPSAPELLGRLQLAQARRTCSSVSSCREAVILWCEGYRRADGDDDGVPCETLCSSLEEVEEIREEIDC